MVTEFLGFSNFVKSVTCGVFTRGLRFMVMNHRFGKEDSYRARLGARSDLEAPFYLEKSMVGDQCV